MRLELGHSNVYILRPKVLTVTHTHRPALWNLTVCGVVLQSWHGFRS